jgi:short-subunit dehydrogenase
MTSFAGKLVLITGASSGIGAAAALDFAKRGSRLILVARRVERLEEVAARIRSAEGDARIVPCDLSDRWARDRLISDLLGRSEIPDILVNNAGYGNSRPFLEETPAEIARMMEVNYLAAAQLMSVFLPEMISRGSGAIVNIASTAGRVAVPDLAAYCASKFALCALTEAVSYETAGSGVTIHLVAPGPVETEFFSAGVWKGRGAGNTVPGRKATAQQVSDAILNAVRKNRLVTYVPRRRGCLVYAFHLLAPLARWVLRHRAASSRKNPQSDQL